jgi:hypothetical protein
MRTQDQRVCVRTGRETAGPSTALRSGRDDNSVAGEMAPKAVRRMATNVATELSSRPERSAVEGPAVSLPVLTQTLASWAHFLNGDVTRN